MSDELNRSKVHFVDVDGVRTRYYEDGDGEPLLLLHGGGFGASYSLDSWSLNLPSLAQSFHVYALDRLGQGRTGNPKRLEDYTFEAIYQHVYDFMQTVGVTRAHVVGHSRGGLVAAHLALRHPSLLRTLVIIDSQTLAGDDPPFYRNLPRHPGPPSRESVRIEPDAQAYSRTHVTDDFLDRMVEIALLPKVAEAQQATAQVGRTLFDPSLVKARDQALALIDDRGIGVPTLVIWALNDRSATIQDYGYSFFERLATVGSSRVDLQACKLEYSIVSPK